MMLPLDMKTEIVIKGDVVEPMLVYLLAIIEYTLQTKQKWLAYSFDDLTCRDVHATCPYALYNIFLLGFFYVV